MKSNEKRKHYLKCGTALALMIGATAGAVWTVNNPATHAKALTLADGDSLFGKINGTIPVIRASNNDTSSKAFQNTVDSLTRELKTQPEFIADVQWTSKTKLKSSSSGTIQPLKNWVSSKGYSIFTDVNGNYKSLYVDGFNGDDLGVQLPIDGSGWVQLSNVGTVKDLKNNKTIDIDMQIKIDGVNLVSPASNLGAIFSAKNQGSTISLGVTPIQSGGQSSGGSSEGGTSAGDGSTVVGANLGYMDNVHYTAILRRHDTGEIIPNDKIVVAMKVSDIDGFQLADVDKNGFLGAIVAKDTALSIEGTGLAYNGAGTTVNDSKNLNKGSYVAIKAWNNIGINFTDQNGKNDPNQGTHFDIVANIFGKNNFQLNLNGSHKITKTQTKQHENQGSGEIEGATFDETIYNADGKTVNTSFNGTFPILDANGKDTGNKAVFKNGVANNLKTGKDGTIYIKDYVPIGSVVKDVETAVPAPYTLGHTNAEGKLVNDPITSTIVSEEDGIATAKFTDNKQVGGVKIAKTAVWSGTNMLSDFYTLAGNTFTISDKDKNVLQTITTDANGVASSTADPTASPLVIGETYTVNEITSSKGFANTFEEKSVKFVYKGADQVIDWENVTGTNTEVTGDIELQKTDDDTNSTETQGKATLSGTDMSFYYAEDIKNPKGEVIHAKDSQVLLTDGFDKNPIKVIKGTLTINKIAPNDKALTVRADNKQQIQIVNLPVGNYYRVETQTSYGYSRDTHKYPFTVAKVNDQTKVIDIDETAENQVLRFNLKLLKALGHDGSLTFENGAEFAATPLDSGTKAINTKFDNANDKATSGSTKDSDGYVSDGQVSFNNLAIGDYTIKQTKVPKGTEAVDDFTIKFNKVTTDGAPDKYVMTVAWKDNGQVISTHEIDASQLLDGNTSMIKLNIGTLTDNEIPPVPSIDVEKSNVAVPNAGNGNGSDKDNNIGANDHDTEATAFEGAAGVKNDIFFRITNNGTEDLTNVKIVDTTNDGDVKVTGTVYTLNGKVVNLNNNNEFVDENGKILILKKGETITAKGTLGELSEGVLHSDEAVVSGIGVTSKLPTGDRDKWYSKPPKPVIDIEKSNVETPKAGEGNYKDKDNNIGVNDHDTQETAFNSSADVLTDIFFNITNKGTEDLTNVKVVDTTTEGKVKVDGITYTYNKQTLKVNEKGELTTEDGKVVTLKVGENITAKGKLGKLSEGELHADEASVTGIGVKSKKTVGDKDKWYGKVPKPVIDVEKSNVEIPKAGEGNEQDKDNNIGVNDHDTQETAFEGVAGVETDIFFNITNKGDEDLTKIKLVDTTKDGEVKAKNFKYDYKGQALKVNENGELTTADGKVITLKVGENITVTATLGKLSEGELHSDEAVVSAVGVTSEKPVKDRDKWYKKSPKPVIDVEKSNVETPKAGEGNNKDKDNNIGVNDHDTQESAFTVKENSETPMFFRITNNGTEDLSNVKFVDKTTDGKVNVDNFKFTYTETTTTAETDTAKGTETGSSTSASKATETSSSTSSSASSTSSSKGTETSSSSSASKDTDTTTDGGTNATAENGKQITLKVNEAGEFTYEDGTPFILKVGESITATGTLGVIDTLHSDEASVTGIGVKSKKTVGDKDKWFGVTYNPILDVEKSNASTPDAGNGNNTDKDNNIGTNDHDTQDTAFSVASNKKTGLFFRITNKGDEDLTNIVPIDKTTNGKVSVDGLTYIYNKQTLKVNDKGELTTEDGKLVTLKVGESITATGTLGSLPDNTLHSDEFTATGIGVKSGKKVGDSDKWFGKTTKTNPIQKIANIFLPKTGDNIFASIISWIGVVAVGAMLYLWKKDSIKNAWKRWTMK